MALNSWLRRLKPLDIRSRICMIRYYPSTLLHSGTLWCDPRTILSSKRGICFSRYYLRDMKTYDLQTQEVAKAFGAVCTPEFYLYKKVICFAISWHEFSWIYCNVWRKKLYRCNSLNWSHYQKRMEFWSLWSIETQTAMLLARTPSLSFVIL